MEKKSCPQKQMLSVYIDGCLPSPWKEKMELHIKACPECGKSLQIYQATSDFLHSEMESNEEISRMEHAKSRILAKIISKTNGKHENILRAAADCSDSAESRTKKRTFLSRSVELPVPFAAAAAAVFVLTISMLMLRQNPSETFTQQDISPAIIPVGYEQQAVEHFSDAKDINEVLNYLDNDDSSNIVFIKLPERKNFNRWGEPKIIKAADYSGGATGTTAK
ncbi:MAG: zf-HC2 domain-containing protein [Spirochaetaceae bacterium]|jgi:hypothetical protein|nr:zf-HC2 domain-containing protein [Spirochaetaceae bacterium]